MRELLSDTRPRLRLDKPAPESALWRTLNPCEQCQEFFLHDRLAVVLNGCVIRPPEPPAPQGAGRILGAAAATLWTGVCGHARAGAPTTPPSPASGWSCTCGSALTARFAFLHAGEDCPRTWILTRTDAGLRLKHDHRHRDGSEDPITQYGGDTADRGTPGAQEFRADAHTAKLIPAAATNVWTVEGVPGQTFYALRREWNGAAVRRVRRGPSHLRPHPGDTDAAPCQLTPLSARPPRASPQRAGERGCPGWSRLLCSVRLS